VQQVTALQQNNTPVFMTGDFNSGSDLRDAQTTVDNDRNKTIYCLLTQNELMWDSYDASRNTSGACPTRNAPGVDHIFLSTFVGATGWNYSITPPGNGSDVHNTLYADIILPGRADSGTNPGYPEKDGWTWPVAKADFIRLSQCFEKPGHTGIDIPVPSGTDVHAAHDGKVLKIDPSGSSDGGKYIIIQHDLTTYSNYQHNSQILVKEGQLVEAGDVIAKSGNTGYTSGPHVHFSITTEAGLDSRSVVAYSVDPLPYLPADRETGSCS
jgi:murein DD-endopeptidase MepM/ murein hydrolase activator NlpD